MVGENSLFTRFWMPRGAASGAVKGEGGPVSFRAVKLFVVAVCFCFGGRWRCGVGVAVLVGFCFGRAGERVSFGGGVVAVVVAVVLVCFCFGRAEGASQLWWWCRRRRPRRPRLFLFWGTEGASQLWWWCRRRPRLFLFWAGGGASQLWWWCRRRRRLFLFRGTVAIWSWV